MANMNDNVHANHRQRMRKRYRQSGLDAFHDHEVLELLLYYCYPRQDTNPIAHKMLNEFKTLQNLFEASTETLMARLGCTENIAVLLSLMPAVAKRYMQSKWRNKQALSDPIITGEFVTGLFIDEQVETFYVLCLDNQYRLNATEQIARGTVDEVPVFVREVVKKALEFQAANVILAHNHPGGSITPSNSDNSLTSRVRDALKLVDIPVIDHIIAAGDKFFSYAQRSRKHVEGY